MSREKYRENWPIFDKTAQLCTPYTRRRPWRWWRWRKINKIKFLWQILSSFCFWLCWSTPRDRFSALYECCAVAQAVRAVHGNSLKSRITEKTNLEGGIPIILKFLCSFRIWHCYITRLKRFTLGEALDWNTLPICGSAQALFSWQETRRSQDSTTVWNHHKIINVFTWKCRNTFFVMFQFPRFIS